MKLLSVIVLAVVLCGCDTDDKITALKKPIILVGKQEKGSIVIRDSAGTYMTFSSDYGFANAIRESYNVGDTLK